MNLNKRKLSTRQTVLGGLFIAIFFLASNLIPAFYVIPNVPVTLQILVVALMGAMLGLRGGLLSLAGLYAATAVGLPMMSGFSGGLAAFAHPTVGYILGWVLLVAAVGFTSDRLSHKKVTGGMGHVGFATILFAVMLVGVLLDYLCGSIFLCVYNGYALRALGGLFIANFTFLPFDAIKCAAASAICVFFAYTPGLSVARQA